MTAELVGVLVVPFLCGAALCLALLLFRHIKLSAKRRSETKFGMAKIATAHEPEAPRTVYEPAPDASADSGYDPDPADADEAADSDEAAPAEEDEFPDSDSEEAESGEPDADDGGQPADDEFSTPRDIYKATKSMPALERHRIPETVKMKDKTVLLAESAGSDRDAISMSFDGSGVKFDFAADGVEVCEKFESDPKRYSMILMNVEMPEMDGYDATRLIRSMDIDWAKQIPIIAMSANALKEEIDACFDAGMDDHVAKPLDMNELRDKVFELIANAE